MGTPVYDDATLFEFLILETFQAGLSWITILNKGRISGKHSTISTMPFIQKTRSNPLLDRNHSEQIESAFCGFNSVYGNPERIWQFSNYIWAFTNGTPIINTQKKFPATTHFLTPLAQI
jgi:DNA-3-methyladenine glycosylase I